MLQSSEKFSLSLRQSFIDQHWINFTHFANFKFAYFEIEESFGLIWVKFQNSQIHLQISILGT